MVSVGVRFVVEGDASEVRFAELSRFVELTVWTGSKGQDCPGHPSFGEIEEAEQIAPKSSVAATAR